MSKVHRTTVSIQNGLYNAALERMKALHHGNFSDYVESLIREDAIRNPEREADADRVMEPKEPYKAKSKRPA